MQRLGFVVLARNWRCGAGELDLITTDGKTLVICEVKTRSGGRFGDPVEAITREKVTRIRSLTCTWLRTFRVGWCPIRFDVIAVYLWPNSAPRIRHLRGAF